MPSTAGFSPRLEGPEGMGAGAEQSSAVPPPHFPLAGLQAQTLYCELAPRAKTAPGPVARCDVPRPLPILGRSQDRHVEDRGSCGPPMPALCRRSLQVMGHSRVQRGATWDSGSSLTLGSSPSPRPGVCPGHSPTARVSLDQSLEPRSTVWIPQVLHHCPFAYP